MATKKKPSRFATQAALESLLRFGPQSDALDEAQRTAEETYDTSVSQARSGAEAMQGAIDTTRPQIAQNYDQAGLAQAALSKTLIGQDLAGLGGVANSIKAGAATEAAGAIGRLGEAKTQALGDLSDRRLQAQGGAIASQHAALTQLTKDLTKIAQSRKDQAGQKGAFEAATVGDLEEAARARALTVSTNNADNLQSERNSVRTSGFDPDTGAVIPGGKADPKTKSLKGKVSATGVKLLSGEKHVAAKDSLQKAMDALKFLDPDKSDRGANASTLVNGHKSVPLYDTKTGKRRISKSGVPLETPDIPAVGALATVAADVYYDGHLSRANQKMLANLGYSINELGLPTYAQWKKQQTPGRARKTVTTALAKQLADQLRNGATLGG